MLIQEYINNLNVKGKKHILMIVTPKGQYPTQFDGSEYLSLENSILKSPTSYIDLFEPDVPEIMQFTAFRLFLKPSICDKENLAQKSISKVNRMSEEQLRSFIVTKHFYDMVPSGKLSEEIAIKEGIQLANKFLEKYPIRDFEFASAILNKDSNEANVLIKIDFMNKDDNYYFDYIYVR